MTCSARWSSPLLQYRLPFQVLQQARSLRGPSSRPPEMQPNPRKTKSVRKLRRVKVTGSRRAVLDLPEAVSDEQDAAKSKGFENLGSTRHNVSRILEDPEWLPHTFNADGDQIMFLRVQAERRRVAPFLCAEWLSDCSRIALPWEAVNAVSQRLSVVPIHFIFHTAFCGSTLLVRVLDAARVASGLVEPAILLNLHFRLSLSHDEAEQARLRVSLKLLGRPLKAAEAVVAKPSCMANPIAPLMLQNSPSSRAVLLSSDLRTFLLAVAKRGPQGLAWGRRVFESCLENLPMEVGYTRQELARLNGLQVSALAWIARRALFEDMLIRFGPERILQVSSGQLFDDPVRAAQRAASFFGLEFDASSLKALAESNALYTHSKETGRRFDLDARAKQQQMLSSTFGTQADAVVEWAEAEGSRKIVFSQRV